MKRVWCKVHTDYWRHPTDKYIDARKTLWPKNVLWKSYLRKCSIDIETNTTGYFWQEGWCIKSAIKPKYHWVWFSFIQPVCVFKQICTKHQSHSKPLIPCWKIVKGCSLSQYFFCQMTQNETTDLFSDLYENVRKLF